ncbi:hypothetical protein AB0K21_16395 [Streptosporangium sp. NPDC049248]|uniref:hypothetical protein n=1 Tax=Streptosporangium sp. NPDC049248 TaxID=3155651 RepID=UPI0034330B92
MRRVRSSTRGLAGSPICWPGHAATGCACTSRPSGTPSNSAGSTRRSTRPSRHSNSAALLLDDTLAYDRSRTGIRARLRALATRPEEVP